MKKKRIVALVSLLSLALVGCDKTSESTLTTDPVSNSEQPSESVSPTEPPVSHTLSITHIGDAKVGESVTFVATFDKTTITDQDKVTYSTTAEGVTIEGRTATFTAAGDVTIHAAYNGVLGTAETDYSITVEEGVQIISIADAKKLADGTDVVVRGVITASGGTSAFIQDETAGMYIYNWYYQTADTAIVNKKFTAGQYVELSAKIASYNGAKQFSNYDSTNKTSYAGTYAKLLDTEAPTINARTLTDPTSLTAADIGELYTFEGTYVSGPDMNSNYRGLVLSVGSGEVILQASAGSSKIYDEDIDTWIAANITPLNLTAGDVVTVTTPFSGIHNNNKNFALYSQGTEISVKEKEAGLSLTAADNTLKVGATTQLTATLTGGDGTETTTYTSSNTEVATVSETGLVTAIGAGEVTITATSSKTDAQGQAYTDSVVLKVIGLSKISAITTKDEYYNVKGVVTATNNQAVVISDDTGSIYTFLKAAPTYSIGDYVDVFGSVTEYHGMLQFQNDLEITVLTDEEKPTIAQAAPLTADIATGWKTDAYSTATNKLYTWTATADKLNNYDTLNIAGSETVIEPAYYSGTIVTGLEYTVEAYFIGYDTKYNYASIVITKLEAAGASIVLDKTSASVNLNDTLQLTASLYGTEETALTWTSSNTAVATVSETGLVTGVSAGSATITVALTSDATIKAECAIEVVDLGDLQTTTITFDSTFASLGTATDDSATYTTADGITFTVNKNKSMTNVTQSHGYISSHNHWRIYQDYTLTAVIDGGRSFSSIEVVVTNKNPFDSTTVTTDKGNVEDNKISQINDSAFTLTAVKQVQLISMTIYYTTAE